MIMNGQRYVVLPESEYDSLVERLGDVKLPAMPEVNSRGRRPARETGRAILARRLIKARVAAGWTQEDLARRAGVRVETISRLESGKHRPQQATLVKIEQALPHGHRD